MRPLFFVLLLACTSETEEETDSVVEVSGGCEQPTSIASGGVQRTLDVSGQGERGYYLVLPDDYDSSVPHALVVGYAGTNWVGEQIRPYLGLEQVSGGGPEIFVYPDPLWHDFPGWGNLGGWLLGPNAGPAEGMDDLDFTAALLDTLSDELCIDESKVYATGHSWGGDMAQVVSCFLGDRFAASVPVAANRPYWFDAPGGPAECTGSTAVWTLFGEADEHFDYQDYPGQFGEECNDFWLDARGCDPDSAEPLPWGDEGDCFAWSGCSSPVQYCLYGPETGHQIPPWYPEATMSFFRGER